MSSGLGTGNSCPEWLDEIPSAMEQQHKAAHRRLYSDVFNCARSRIANDQTFKRWHQILFEGCAPVRYYVGNYRQLNYEYPCLAVNVEVNGLPGADYKTVLDEMERLSNSLKAEISQLELRWPNLTFEERTKKVALILAAAIGTFIRIHPFVNKNGTISRVIWRWGLTRFGVPPQVRISPRPEHPYSRAMACSMEGKDGMLAYYILSHLRRHPPKIEM